MKLFVNSLVAGCWFLITTSNKFSLPNNQNFKPALNHQLMKIQAILFDMIGTTVHEKIPNTIRNCFRLAFEKYDVEEL